LVDGVPDWYASALNNLGSTLSQSGDCEEALPFMEEAIEMYESLSGGDPANTGNTRSHYGACLTELGRYQGAEAALLAEYPAIQAGRGDERRWTTRTVGRLATLYEAWGKTNKAADYRR
jgi:tetratricopeptide (TPR) repeat protein